MRFFAQLAAALLILPLLGTAQLRHDPLNDKEIDQLRDAAMNANARLKLYTEFARTRLTAIEQMRADPKTKDRAQQTHNGLRDFLAVYDELDENIDNFEKRDVDLRKPLKFVIEADNEFQAKLRAIHDAANVTPDELRQYEFELSDALDTLDASVKDHRDLLAEQEEAAKHKKKPTQTAPVREFR